MFIAFSFFLDLESLPKVRFSGQHVYKHVITKRYMILTVQKVTRIKHCYCCNSEFDSCRFSCSIPYVARYADSYFV